MNDGQQWDSERINTIALFGCATAASADIDALIGIEAHAELRRMLGLLAAGR